MEKGKLWSVFEGLSEFDEGGFGGFFGGDGGGNTT